VNEPPDAIGPAGCNHVAHPVDIERLDLSPGIAEKRYLGGQVVDDLGTADRLEREAGVGEVTPADLGIEPLQRTRVTADERTHSVPGREQGSHQVAAHVSRRAGHDNHLSQPSALSPRTPRSPW